MIYIVGYSFQFNSRPKPSLQSGSIQEQLLLSKRAGIKSTVNDSFFAAGFIAGNTYRIACIKPIIENENKRVQYLFVNMTNKNQSDIVVVFDNTAAGDEYIAAISGKQKELENERNLIKTAFEQEGAI